MNTTIDMRTKNIFMAFVLLSFLTANLSLTFCSADLDNGAGDKLVESFEAVYEAEELGGNVSDLVEELNLVIALIENGKAEGNAEMLEESISRSEAVISSATLVGINGAGAAYERVVKGEFTLVLIVVSTFLVWRYGNRVFWIFWIKSKRDWRVKRRS